MMSRYLFAALVFMLCSFRIAPDGGINDQVIAVADSQLDVYLAKIEPGKEADYGFTDKDVLDDCVLGKPYRIIEFNRAFYYSPVEENTDYIDIKNKWLVPISLSHQYRAFLAVEGNAGNLSVTGMGNAKMAKEIQLLSMAASDSNEFYILKVPRLSADFFVHEANGSFADARFTPLESAVNALPQLDSKKEEYTLGEIQHLIKAALEQKK